MVPFPGLGFAKYVGDRVLLDRNLLQRPRAGTTIILSAGVVRAAPFVEAVRTPEAFVKLSAEEIRISVILP